MTVHFIGAGPGAADLLTVRGLNLVRRCPLILYAGSLIPLEIVAEAPPDATVMDTVLMTLPEIIQCMQAAHAAGQDVARLQSGDLSLYSAVAEQIRALDALAIPWTWTPGVPAFAAATALLGHELTLPGASQTVILTRTAVRAGAVPESEDLASYARSGATLAIHLAINNLAAILRTLVPILGETAPVVVVYRATWPEERILAGTLADIRGQVKAAGITRTALILVGGALAASPMATSRLYAPDHAHALRPKRP